MDFETVTATVMLLIPQTLHQAKAIAYADTILMNWHDF